MRAERKILWCLGIGLTLLLLTPFARHFQVKWELAHYRKKLKAAGEKLEISELSPRITSASTNAATALRLMKAIPIFSDVFPKTMKFIQPGVARVAWREPVLKQYNNFVTLDVDIWPKLRAALKTNEQNISELTEFLNNNEVQILCDYSQVPFSGLDLMRPAYTSVPSLGAFAILALHDGRFEAAYKYLRANTAALWLFSDNPLVACQSSRFAKHNRAVGATWEALLSDDWTDEQWNVIQNQWETLDYLRATEATLEMERSRSPLEFETTRKSKRDLSQFLWGQDTFQSASEIINETLQNPREGISDFNETYPHYWSWKWIGTYQDERRYFEFMQSMIELIRDVLQRGSVLTRLAEVERKGDAEYSSRQSSRFELGESEKSLMQGFVFQTIREQTEAQMTVAAIALKRFHMAHNSYPATLGDLVPRFIQRVPVDYMDGQDLRYRPNPDGTYLLYSVGGDGVNNGGDPIPPPGTVELTGSLSHGGLAEGRDWVWPRAATVEEVKAFDVREAAEKAKAFELRGDVKQRLRRK